MSHQVHHCQNLGEFCASCPDLISVQVAALARREFVIGSPSASKQAQRSRLVHDVGRWDDGMMGRCRVFLAQEGSWQSRSRRRML